MFYRIKFKAAPQEFIVETIQGFILGLDLLEVVRTNFNIYKSELLIFDESGKTLREEDYIEDGRTYIIKRVPFKPVYKCKKLWYR